MIKHGISRFTDQDIYLFKEGNHFRLYDKLGSHQMSAEGEEGVYFGVWAPNADKVSVVGDFNGWDKKSHRLSCRLDSSGIWEGFIPGLATGCVYKYHISSKYDSYTVDKGDPYAFAWERAPRTASIVTDLNYTWNDDKWMAERKKANALDAPYAVYEVHLGSWRRVPEEDNRYLTYREMAHQLADYVKEMGFTHIELMPIM
ncbi:1,4-alpha-glucan branching enzyme, partial [bacterium]|nr:1,4-alpha-glucan branching enzyme [bacterium]